VGAGSATQAIICDQRLLAVLMPDTCAAPPVVSYADTVNRAPPHVPLAMVTRGPATESVHYGSVAVVDCAGKVLYAAGDPRVLTMTRSALKPFQAIPFVAVGGSERFGYTAAQLAL